MGKIKAKLKDFAFLLIMFAFIPLMVFIVLFLLADDLRQQTKAVKSYRQAVKNYDTIRIRKFNYEN